MHAAPPVRARPLLDYGVVGPADAAGRGGRALRLLLAALAFPAVAAIFLEFTWSTSPWDVIVETPEAALDMVADRSFDDDDLVLLALAWPFALAVPILAMRLRLLLPWRVGRPGTWSALTLACLSAGASLGVMARLSRDAGTGEEPRLILLAGAASLAVAVSLVVLAARLRRPTWAIALAALHAAWVVNAALCLVGFRDDQDLGYLATLLACIAAAIDLTWLVTRSGRHGSAAGRGPITPRSGTTPTPTPGR